MPERIDLEQLLEFASQDDTANVVNALLSMGRLAELPRPNFSTFVENGNLVWDNDQLYLAEDISHACLSVLSNPMVHWFFVELRRVSLSRRLLNHDDFLFIPPLVDDDITKEFISTVHTIKAVLSDHAYEIVRLSLLSHGINYLWGPGRENFLSPPWPKIAPFLDVPYVADVVGIITAFGFLDDTAIFPCFSLHEPQTLHNINKLASEYDRSHQSDGFSAVEMLETIACHSPTTTPGSSMRIIALHADECYESIFVPIYYCEDGEGTVIDANGCVYSRGPASYGRFLDALLVRSAEEFLSREF